MGKDEVLGLGRLAHEAGMEWTQIRHDAPTAAVLARQGRILEPNRGAVTMSDEIESAAWTASAAPARITALPDRLFESSPSSL